jgi:hypothetical protein
VLDVKDSKETSRQLLASGIGMAGLGKEKAYKDIMQDKNKGGLTAVVNWRVTNNDLTMDGADISPQTLGHKNINL